MLSFHFLAVGRGVSEGGCGDRGSSPSSLRTRMQGSVCMWICDSGGTTGATGCQASFRGGFPAITPSRAQPLPVACPLCSPQDEDSLVRGLSVLCNLASQLYYPCEHVAWAADAGIIPVSSRKWWTLSTVLWAVSLLLGILRSLRILFQLRRKLRQHKRTSSPQSQQEMKAQVKAEVLSVLTDAADLANAIHWLPPGFLWAGRFPPWLVGLLGTISSLIGIYQASRRGNSEAV
uniref:Peroxisomal biogenesis factor 11 gamma n=1 Tax=Bubo bubo TaxID=30461 RepID=A0A8C0FCY5_BUBBB